MKLLKIICVFLFSAFFLSAAAQERGIDSLFREYAGKKGYTSVVYGSRMLKMMGDGASVQVKELLYNIDVIRIISTETFGRDLRDEALGIADDSSYELVSEVKDDEVSTSFFFREEPCGKSSFLMVTFSGTASAVLDVYGKFDVRDISKLSAITG